MPNSIGRGIEWCENYGWTGDVCYCEASKYLWPETKCPDLGDWSDTPHDQLDGEHNIVIARMILSNYDRLSIALDRDRLLSYIED